MNKSAVIIDCDPGLDDVVALVMALSSELLDVRAVTVVGGNQTLEIVGKNALDLVDFLGRKIPVGLGASGPLKNKLETAGQVHGEDGIYGVKLPRASSEFSDLDGVELMYRLIMESEEKVGLIATGPLTNIALLLTRYPEVESKISGLSLMGGGIKGGNVTDYAEFNFYVDPEAAKLVFDSDLEITMAGLDVTHKARIFREDIDRIRTIDNPVADLVAKMLEGLLDYSLSIDDRGCPLHDPVAVCYLTHPHILESEEMKLSIELEGEKRGASLLDSRGRKCRVLKDIDREAFLEVLYQSVASYM